MIQPRDYQIAAVRAVQRAWRSCAAPFLVTAPPGSGKTVMIAELARRELNRKRRVLILAQRREILRQTFAHVAGRGVSAAVVGRVWPDSGEDPDLSRPLQIASVQTVLRRGLAQKFKADVVLLDEAHHACADGHAGILDRCGTETIAGFTATPCRRDGRGLGDIFANLYAAAVPSGLIQRGLLAKPRTFTPPEEFLPTLTGVKRALGDYVASDVEARVNRRKLVGRIVYTYQKHAAGRTAIVFASTVRHSRHITERFQAAGVAAEHIDASASLAERDAIIERLRRGETQVVCNVGILYEGFDLPRTYAVVLARPTLSLALYLQQTGRALRKYSNHRPVILDHAGNALRFGLPEADRSFTLAETVKQQSVATPCTSCPECGAVVLVGCTSCPECGAELRCEIPEPEEDPTRALAELAAAQKRAFVARLKQLIASRPDEDWREFEQRAIELWTAYNSGA